MLRRLAWILTPGKQWFWGASETSRCLSLQDAKLFIAKCLGPPEDRPSVGQLLEDRFFCRKPQPPRPPSLTGEDSGLSGRDSFAADDHHRGGSSGAG